MRLRRLLLFWECKCGANTHEHEAHAHARPRACELEMLVRGPAGWSGGAAVWLLCAAGCVRRRPHTHARSDTRSYTRSTRRLLPLRAVRLRVAFAAPTTRVAGVCTPAVTPPQPHRASLVALRTGARPWQGEGLIGRHEWVGERERNWCLDPR